MKKVFNNKRLTGIIIMITVFVLIMLYLFVSRSSDEKVRQVSMIVYGDDAEHWENMREGAYLVSSEKNARLNLLTMLTDNDPEEQKEIINREIEDGADALIIASCSSAEIKEYIDSLNLRIPVVYLETVENASVTDISISADDYNMGYELGEELVRNESDIVTVAILSGNTDRDSVRLREEGFRAAIEGKVGKVIDWSGLKLKTVRNIRPYIQREIVSEATDVIVTFDNLTTDALLDALSNLNQTCKIYAVSTSNKAVYDLDAGEIVTLQYPDEFSMGYLAAMYALDPNNAKGRYSHNHIEYRMVRKEDMYSEENQTLLFPFVD